MLKYGFKIRTRSGLVVDNLLIPGKDQADAERKLSQIYRNCEILESKSVQMAGRDESMDMEQRHDTQRDILWCQCIRGHHVDRRGQQVRMRERNSFGSAGGTTSV